MTFRESLNFAFCILIFELILILPACGRKGNPSVPIHYMPGMVENLVASPKENTVLLRWRGPEKNDDGTSIKDLSGFVILRAEIPVGIEECRCEYKKIKMIDLNKPYPAYMKGEIVYYLDKGEDLSPQGLSYGKTYGYKVFSMNKSKILSREKDSRVMLSVPPGPPERLKTEIGEGKVTLRWAPPIKKIDGTELTDLKGYNIYRSREKGVYEDDPVNPGLIISNTYTDQGLENNKTYYYTIKAANNTEAPFNEGPVSEEISATPQKLTPPGSPKRLIAVPAEGKIFLTWDENKEPELSGYKVYRSTTPKTGYILLTQEPINKTTYTDKYVNPDIKYYYRVTAVDNAPKPNESLPSEEVEAQIKYIR